MGCETEPRLENLDERIDDSDTAVQPIVLKIFRYQLVQTVMLGIRPEMRVKPAQLIRSGAAKGEPDKSLVRIEHRKLCQELFGFAYSIGKGK